MGPLPSRRGCVLFLMDLTLTLGMGLPSPRATLLPKLPSVDYQAGLSTITVLHTALLLTTKVTSQQKKCSNGPRPRNSPVPPGAAPRRLSLRIDTSQFLVINLHLYKSPIGCFTPPVSLWRTLANARTLREEGQGPSNPDVTFLLSALPRHFSSARGEKVECDPVCLRQTMA